MQLNWNQDSDFFLFSNRNQEKVNLKLNLAASHKVHQSTRSQLEQEVKCLKKEVTCLQHELGTTQKVFKLYASACLPPYLEKAI